MVIPTRIVLVWGGVMPFLVTRLRKLVNIMGLMMVGSYIVRPSSVKFGVELVKVECR
ncbi:MAG: hypothetical protein Fur0025_32770 [Oscillatoriaceae cyanobacterium]